MKLVRFSMSKGPGDPIEANVSGMQSQLILRSLIGVLCRGGRVPRRPAVTYRDLGLYCQQYENGKTYRHSNEGGYFHHEDNDSTLSCHRPSLNRYIYLSKARSAYPLVKCILLTILFAARSPR